MNKTANYLCTALLALSSCVNALDIGEVNNSDGGLNTLSIHVFTDPITKDLITSKYLQNGSEVGVFVKNTTEGAYDGHAYDNILFTAFGSEANQTWNGTSAIELSMNTGNCYAYYPYNSEVDNVTAIPVSTTGQVDYLYATPVTVDAENKHAKLTMNHALAAVRFKLRKGTYTGAGTITAVSVQSSALGNAATLNAKTGKLSSVAGTNTPISISKQLTLSEVTPDVDVIVVPTETSADLTLSVTLDGKTYSMVASGTTVNKTNCYEYTLTDNKGELALSGFEIGDWTYNESGAPTITAAGYKVTFAGNYADLAFGNSVSGNTVTIKAINYDGNPVNKVTVSAGATLAQSVSGKTRVITLTDIASDVTVTFYGTVSVPAAIANTWTGLPDGIYAIRPDRKPANAADGNELCIGVGLIHSATGQKLMIEKFEDANNPESTSTYLAAAQTLGSDNTNTFSWGGWNIDQSLTNYTQVGAGSSEMFGYLPKSNGLYADVPKLNSNPSTWSSSGGALSDFAGKSNSTVVKTIETNGGSIGISAPMGFLIKAFNSTGCPTSVNQGCTDWYIPSCGQLGLIYMNKTKLNEALSAIGGTPFTDAFYWTSTEYNIEHGRGVGFGNGLVNGNYKTINQRIRLVRDL